MKFYAEFVHPQFPLVRQVESITYDVEKDAVDYFLRIERNMYGKILNRIWYTVQLDIPFDRNSVDKI